VRSVVERAQRVVVKVGSSSLTTAAGGLDPDRLGSLVEAIRPLAGGRLVLVSSGAIAAGLAPLGLARRPRDLATLQAAASVGQSALVHQYAEAFGRSGHRVGQVLLTATDVIRRTHYRNARTALDRLLELGIVPIINENDAVATQEIRFGDNDRLAALVAQLVNADALILLSDVDALYTKPPHEPGAERITDVPFGDELAGVTFGAPGAAGVGSGGAGTKVAAARLAAASGTPVLITETGSAMHALSGADLGTWFEAARN
jgi:glutamate 5-kinase